MYNLICFLSSLSLSTVQCWWLHLLAENLTNVAMHSYGLEHFSYERDNSKCN